MMIAKDKLIESPQPIFDEDRVGFNFAYIPRLASKSI